MVFLLKTKITFQRKTEHTEWPATVDGFLGAGSTGMDTFGELELRTPPLDKGVPAEIDPAVDGIVFGVEALLDLWRTFKAA